MRLVLLAAVLLAGCGKPITNDEIIAETKKCEAAGMKAEALRDLDGKVWGIQCAPREANK